MGRTPNTRKDKPEPKSDPAKLEAARNMLEGKPKKPKKEDRVQTVKDAKDQIGAASPSTTNPEFSNKVGAGKNGAVLDSKKVSEEPATTEKKKEKPKKDKPIEETIMARYNFTDKELRELSEQVALKIEKRDDLESEKKACVSTFKEKIDVITHEIKQIASCLRNGHEQRQYRCIVTKDYKKSVKVYKDINTKKVVDTRPFDPDDYQRKFA